MHPHPQFSPYTNTVRQGGSGGSVRKMLQSHSSQDWAQLSQHSALRSEKPPPALTPQASCVRRPGGQAVSRSKLGAMLRGVCFLASASLHGQVCTALSPGRGRNGRWALPPALAWPGLDLFIWKAAWPHSRCGKGKGSGLNGLRRVGTSTRGGCRAGIGAQVRGLRQVRPPPLLTPRTQRGPLWCCSTNF